MGRRRLCQCSQHSKLRPTRPRRDLQKENDKYLLMCNEGKGDQYSASEVKFYSAEIEELNKSLDERGHLRQEKVNELEGKMMDMSKIPLEEFIQVYKVAVEDLC